MAITIPAANRSVRWNDREVRRLLRLLRRPKALEYSPLALAVQSALGAATPYAAVLAVIERSLHEYGREGRELFTLLKRCDIDGDATPLGVAYDLNLSTRQFYRYRARAVSIIVAYLDALFRVRAVDANPIRALARLTQSFDPQTALKIYALDAFVQEEDHSMLEASICAGNAAAEIEAALSNSPNTLRVRAKLATAFARRGDCSKARATVNLVRRALASVDARASSGIELEISLTEFLLARYEAAPDVMLEIARKVRASAGTKTAAHLQATLCEAQAALHAGDFGSALGALRALVNLPAVHHDPPLMGEVVLRMGETFFAAGDLFEARRHAAAASLTLRHIPHLSVECELLLDRIRLSSGGNAENTAADGVSHDALMASSLRARGLLAQGKVELGEEIARGVLAISRESNLRGLEIWNLATLAAASFIKGDPQKARSHAEQAWTLLIRVRDFNVAADAFTAPGMENAGLGPFCLDDAFENMLDEAMAFVPVPDARRAFCRAVRSIVKSILSRTEARRGLLPETQEIVEALRRAGAQGDLIRRHQRAATLKLSYFLAALLPIDARGEFRQTLAQALDELLRSVAQGISRAS